MGVLIRASTERDIPAIAGLLDALNDAEGYSTRTDAQKLKHALMDEGREVRLSALVAQSDDHVVGVLLYYPGYDTLSASVGYHLADMVVSVAHQRQGIGRMLVQALAKQTLNEQKEWISLTALKRNTAAREFYLAMGMTQVEVDFFAIGRNALAQL